MGVNTLLDRLGALFRAALAPAPDPRHGVDRAYELQAGLLQQVRAALREVTAARSRLEVSHEALKERVQQLEDEAAVALAGGREEAARQLVYRRLITRGQLETIRQKLQEVAEKQRRLILVEDRLTARFETLRTRREAAMAGQEARLHIQEALSQVPLGIGSAGLVSDEATYLDRISDVDESLLDRLTGLIEATDVPWDGATTLFDDVEELITREIQDLKSRQEPSQGAGAEARKER